MQYVNALSPPIAGERVGVEGWGGNGHLLEVYSTKPTCKPQSTMCSFWDLRRYIYAVAVVVAVAAVAGRGKLKNVKQALQLMDSIYTTIIYQKLMISKILPTFTSVITLPMLAPSWPKCVVQLSVAQYSLSPRWPYTIWIQKNKMI